MKYKVAQIIPYFGQWPEWIELYFYSCGRNPMIDFIFFTNCPLPKHQYHNTIFHQCSYDEYCNLVSERLSINFHCNNPYKLTDLKPFIGAVHEPELREYDFWGFGDLDLVYGDLNILVNDKNLKRYNVITTHNYHIAGHFCICRNNDYYRNLCFKIKDWKHRLVEEHHYAFDENEWAMFIHPFMGKVHRLHHLTTSKLGLHYFTILNFLNPLLYPKVLLKEFRTSLSPDPEANDDPIQPQIRNKVWNYHVKDGRIYDFRGIELPYLHFLFFKKNIWSKTEYYWRDGFYQLDSDFEKYRKITFDCVAIKGIN